MTGKGLLGCTHSPVIPLRDAGMTRLLTGKMVSLIYPITVAVINGMCKNIEY